MDDLAPIRDGLLDDVRAWWEQVEPTIGPVVGTLVLGALAVSFLLTMFDSGSGDGRGRRRRGRR